MERSEQDHKLVVTFQQLLPRWIHQCSFRIHSIYMVLQNVKLFSVSDFKATWKWGHVEKALRGFDENKSTGKEKTITFLEVPNFSLLKGSSSLVKLWMYDSVCVNSCIFFWIVAHLMMTLCECLCGPEIWFSQCPVRLLLSLFCWEEGEP